MTKEEIKQKTSLCFLLNPNISEEEKICVIEKVMATKATIVSKVALCNIITYILKQNAELKEQIEQMKCCENCRYYSRTYEHCYSYDSYQNCKALSNWRLAE